MQLTQFIKALLTSGDVNIQPDLLETDTTDDLECGKILRRFYQEDALHMPFKAPGFDEAAAVWAARHLYLSLQLIVLRDIPEETAREKIVHFQGSLSPAAIYSADLVLRHLPQVFNFAKGLAPSDVMVAILQETAAYWPFSSVGIELTGEPDETIILSHPSLRTEYADRIINAKDIKRVSQLNRESIQEAVGNYGEIIWPEFNEVFTKASTCTPATTAI